MDNELETKGTKNPKIVSPKDGDVLKFCHSKRDLEDPDTFAFFIKNCEKCVRNDPRYDNYIYNLKRLGYIRDVFQAGIDSERFPNTHIEMHHGPMFTLFDICAIVTDHLLADDEKVTTFDIADRVLTEHEKGHIQVVMGLTETNHQLVHDGKLFVHITQAIGDILGFIKAYKKGFRKEHLYTMEEYLKLCSKYEATDNDYLVLRTAAKKIFDNIDKYNS